MLDLFCLNPCCSPIFNAVSCHSHTLKQILFWQNFLLAALKVVKITTCGIAGKLSTETEIMSFWRNIHHWLHWQFWKWQFWCSWWRKMLSKWHYFHFFVVVSYLWTYLSVTQGPQLISRCHQWLSNVQWFPGTCFFLSVAYNSSLQWLSCLGCWALPLWCRERLIN